MTWTGDGYKATGEWEYEYAVDDGPEAPGIGPWMRRKVTDWEPVPKEADNDPQS